MDQPDLNEAGLRFRTTMEDFLSALIREDQLGMVIRAHIVIESSIVDYINSKITQLRICDAIKLDYDAKVSIALALGLDSKIGPPLRALGKLRNSFAHQHEMQIGKQEINNLKRGIGAEVQHGRDLMKKLDTNNQFEAGSIRAETIAVFQTIFACVAVAAYHAAMGTTPPDS